MQMIAYLLIKWKKTKKTHCSYLIKRVISIEWYQIYVD